MKRLLIIIITTSLVLNYSCTPKGLIYEGPDPDKYRIDKKLPDGPQDYNPSFIVFGDTRPGWRILEKFLLKKSWATPNMLIIPFYQIHWIGNGLLGLYEWAIDSPNYGSKERRMVRDAIYREAKTSNIDFILHTGDIVTEGRRGDHWRQFIEEYKIESPLIDEYPLIPTLGGHEWASDTLYGKKNYESVFEYPPFFVLEFKDVDIFVIDADLIVDQKDLIDDDEQDRLFKEWFVSGDSNNEAWLEGKLKASQKKFKIISMHYPPVSFNVHHYDWEKPKYGNALPDKRDEFIDLLKRYNVNAIFTAHEHLYEHSILSYAGDNSIESGKIHF
ncbi:MAG: hypothetical protein GY863_11505, partial [bacterium]|nr:hypothetical protein [bacterium]